MPKTPKPARVVVAEKDGGRVVAVYKNKNDPKPTYVVKYRGVGSGKKKTSRK